MAKRRLLTRPVLLEVSGARRWSMLAVGTFAQASAAAVYHGPAFLIPALTRQGLTLAEAGFVVAAPLAGVMVSLIAWGFIVDRKGERFGLLVGLTGAALAMGTATAVNGTVLLAGTLFIAGGCAAVASSASGRMVVGWFPVERRGLAMGIRQTSSPLGVALSAVIIAPVSVSSGINIALWMPTAAVGMAVILCIFVVIDPPRPIQVAGARSPYRRDRFLPRVHLASILLVVPQYAVWTFSVSWLVDDLRWSAALAGAVVALTQVLGATGRVAVGWISDLVGSRMRPLQWVAWAASGSMLLLGLTAGIPRANGIAVILMVVASTVTVADNGLAFTAVAERAGPFWAGRALGVQNTAQFFVGSVILPAAGGVASVWGYPAMFALCALFPLLAIGVVPLRSEQSAS